MPMLVSRSGQRFTRTAAQVLARNAETNLPIHSRKMPGKPTKEKESPKNRRWAPAPLRTRNDQANLFGLRADNHTNLVTVHRTRQNLRLSSEKRLSTAN